MNDEFSNNCLSTNYEQNPLLLAISNADFCGGVAAKSQ
jgi:hypothetical protein